MTSHCFSKSQLYALRNEIDVRMLIEKTLCIPCRVTQGCFRFLCPLCNGFNTAVNPKTNLARCFACEKNFNTIDLVMLIRQTDFVHSVKFLQSILQKEVFRPTPDTDSPIDIRKQPPRWLPDETSKHFQKNLTMDRVTSERFLAMSFPLDVGCISEKRDAESKPEKPIEALEKADEDRIIKLELQLEQLGRQIQKLTRTINVGLPSK